MAAYFSTLGAKQYGAVQVARTSSNTAKTMSAIYQFHDLEECFITALGGFDPHAMFQSCSQRNTSPLRNASTTECTPMAVHYSGHCDQMSGLSGPVSFELAPHYI